MFDQSLAFAEQKIISVNVKCVSSVKMKSRGNQGQEETSVYASIIFVSFAAENTSLL